MQENSRFPVLDFDEFRRLVCGMSGRRTVYEIELRRLWKQGLSPIEAEQVCTQKRLFHRVYKNREATGLGRPSMAGKPRLVTLTHETVVRRLADAIALQCRKLLKHRMEENDLKLIRGLKDQCDNICLRPRDDEFGGLTD